MGPSLTVAIPAYNEEGTIEHILHALLEQERNNFRLDGIAVYSDGCTDNTVARVREMQGRFPDIIRLVESDGRHGRTYQLNRIFADNSSDFLMVLDADIGLDGEDFLDRFVVAALSDDKAVMFAAHQTPLQPRDFIGKVFHASFLLWDHIRLSIPDKDHVHNFYGAATIYRKRFAETLTIPDEAKSTRSFLYLMAKRAGGFRYVDDARITYWPPHTADDFFRLKERVFGSDQDILENIFGTEAENVYVVPLKYKFIGAARFLKEHPFLALPAVALNWLLGRLTPKSQNNSTSLLWSVAVSTKKTIKDADIILSSYDEAGALAEQKGSAVHHVAQSLSERFDVRVLTRNYFGAKKKDVRDGIVYRHIGFPFPQGKIGLILFQMALPLHVFFERYDIWIENPASSFSLLFMPLLTKKPVIYFREILRVENQVRYIKQIVSGKPHSIQGEQENTSALEGKALRIP